MAPKSSKRAEKEFRRNAMQFRDLLLDGRELYAKGRAHAAVDLQKKALDLGTKVLPRFEENSLVKAHVLVELGLAYSAICTDFATGKEWEEAKEKMDNALDQAMGIFLKRRSQGTLTVFRREECWIKGDKYSSPVPHTERLGPVDYLTSIQMAVGLQNPTVETVHKLKRAIEFGLEFKAAKCAIHMEAGPSLQGELPADILVNVKTCLKNHEHAVATGKSPFDSVEQLKEPATEEVRHTGTRHGKMKPSNASLVADIEKRGLVGCAFPECQEMEKEPRQFPTCSRCKWAAYCCRNHQTLDWKRHKKECSTVAVQQRQDYKQQRKSQDTLMPGQTQQFMTVVRYLHTFYVNSPEGKAMQETMGFPLPQWSSVDDHCKLSMPQVAMIWECLWSMHPSKRESMLRRFVEKTQYEFDSEKKGGPPISAVLSWNANHVIGVFAVVEHTPMGSILLHDPGDGKIVAYRVVGISDSVETMLKPIGRPLPQMIRTVLIPFKQVIVTHGCFSLGVGASRNLMAAAAAYKSGERHMGTVTSLLGTEP